MGKFEDLFGNFVMISLLVLGMFALVMITQADNDASQPLSDNELFRQTYRDLNKTMSNLEGTSETQYGTFITDKPTPGIGAIVLFSIINVGKTFGNVMFVLFTLIIKLPLLVFGIDQTIISMILSFLTITVIIALWIVYKFGG